MKAFRIDAPCHETWDDMRDDGASRFCGSCDKRVFDLAAMTETQIRGLALVSGGRFCGRQIIRDGELVTRPEPVVRTPSRLWPIRVVALAGALSAAACGSAPTAATPTPTPITMSQGVAPALATSVTHGSTPTPVAPQGELVANEERQILGDIPHVPKLPTQVSFSRGSAKLDKEAGYILDAAYAFLSEQPSGLAVMIEGHLSADEAPSKNGRRLAQARAEVVHDALVKLGVDPKRLRVASFGFDRPLTREPGEAAQRMNRRVSMRICADDTCPPV